VQRRTGLAQQQHFAVQPIARLRVKTEWREQATLAFIALTQSSLLINHSDDAKEHTENIHRPPRVGKSYRMKANAAAVDSETVFLLSDQHKAAQYKRSE